MSTLACRANHLPKNSLLWAALGSLLLFTAGCDPLHIVAKPSDGGTVKPVKPAQPATDLPTPPIPAVADRVATYWAGHTDVPVDNLARYYGALWAAGDALEHDGKQTGDEQYFKSLRDVKLYHTQLLLRLELPTASPFAQELASVFDAVEKTESAKLAENNLRQQLVDTYRSAAIGCGRAAIARGVNQQTN